MPSPRLSESSTFDVSTSGTSGTSSAACSPSKLQHLLFPYTLGMAATEEALTAPNIFQLRVDEDFPLSGRGHFEKPPGCVSNLEEVQFTPHLRSIQHIVLYETKARYYIIGSNVSGTKFNIMKIDRTEPRELVIHESDSCHNRKELVDILNMVDSGNFSKVGQKVGSGLVKKLSAFGIVGFVRFLEGYYIVFITKRRRVAMIGHHYIYKVEDIELVYIPNDDARQSHADEARYVKMFLAIDMSSNFYFSYSYDITNTLQHNLTAPQFVATQDLRWQDLSSSFPNNEIPSELSYIGEPNQRFMWNEYLLESVANEIKPDWMLPIIHGFVDQSNVSIHGQPILLTLIARRSKKYAGTRFLKRGANFHGDVANEVESEQIVGDSSITNLNLAKMSSFVQIRGSFPGHWAQDISKMVPKPQIFFEAGDPYGRTSGNHFDQLMQKYGSPIIVLNLVKKRERRRHECLIEEEFGSQVAYLNKFLPQQYRIKYIHFDMARCKKREDREVMTALGERAEYGVIQNGIFLSQISKSLGPKKAFTPKGRSLAESHSAKISELPKGERFLRQTGVVRTNCIDCLDRTNTAQFVVAKSALALQLYAIGYLDEPVLEFNSDCARMLEAMFEDHGDTLALQYGGSQLIHRIKSYRKESKWTSKANDITQTVVRYYSNTLSDAEKQNTINLFLGVFRAQLGKPAIWDIKEFNGDRGLHLPESYKPYDKNNVLYQIRTHWWNPKMRNILPYPLLERQKKCLQIFVANRRRFLTDKIFEDFYRIEEMSVFNDLFQFKDISHSVRDYMPNCCTDYSPFVIRQRELKKREENLYPNRNSLTSFLVNFAGQKYAGIANSNNNNKSSQNAIATIRKNPSVDGISSNVSYSSSGKDTSDSEDGDTSSQEFGWTSSLNLKSESVLAICEEESSKGYSEMFKDQNDMNWDTEVTKEDVEMFNEYAASSQLQHLESNLKTYVRMKEILPKLADSSNEFSNCQEAIEVDAERLAYFEKYMDMTYEVNEKDMKLFEDYALASCVEKLKPEFIL